MIGAMVPEAPIPPVMPLYDDRQLVHYQDMSIKELEALKASIGDKQGLYIFYTEKWPDDTGYDVTKELTEAADGCIITDYDIFEKIRVDGDLIFSNFQMKYLEILPDVI